MQIEIQKGSKILLILTDTFSFGSESEIILNKNGTIIDLHKSVNHIIHDKIKAANRYVYFPKESKKSEGLEKEKEEQKELRKDELKIEKDDINNYVKDEVKNELDTEGFSVDDTLGEFIDIILTDEIRNNIAKKNFKKYLKVKLNELEEEFFEM